MAGRLPYSGKLGELDVAELFWLFCASSQLSRLIVTIGEFEKSVYFDNGQVLFTTSADPKDSLGTYLLSRRLLDDRALLVSGDYMKQKKVRHGRALQELHLIDAETLWHAIQEQNRLIAYGLFACALGSFRVDTNPEPFQENILLCEDIRAVMAEGIRRIPDETFIQQRMQPYSELFFVELPEDVAQRLKNTESHVLELAKRYARIETVLAKSELLAADTLKVLYMLLRLHVLTHEPGTAAAADAPESAESVGGHFKSFEDALDFYNQKYTYIYKMLSREIGPVAVSILSQALSEISDNIPSYLKSATLTPTGSIESKLVLKAVWYLDFSRHYKDFIRGLEEILYAEIYAVKKHLGRDYEQNILQWLRETAN